MCETNGHTVLYISKCTAVSRGFPARLRQHGFVRFGELTVLQLAGTEYLSTRVLTKTEVIIVNL